MSRFNVLLAVALCGPMNFACDEKPDEPAAGQAAVAPEAKADTKSEAKAESKFLRFVEEPDGSARLESAIRRYTDDQGRVVDLIGAVHIADGAFYDELNSLFKTYDALLYEAVAKKDQRPTGGGGDSPVSKLQRGMKDLLDLEFQLDGIDYMAENFVHADLEPAEFFQLMDEKGESLFTLMLQVMLSEMKRGSDNPEEAQAQGMLMVMALFAKDRARALKVVLGKQFDDLERLSAGLERGLDGEGSVLVVERNKAALRAMTERLDAGDQRLGIFYGAAHLADMEARLIETHGFEQTSETWQTAWNIPPTTKTGTDG